MKNNYFIPRLIACVGVLCFVACEKNAPTPSVAPLPSGPVSTDKKSTHFDAVVNRLELGGEYFYYSDHQDDAKKLAQFLQDILALVVEAKPDLVPPGMSVNMPAIVEELGLTKIAATGKSSSERGNSYYHSRQYYYMPAGRSGIFNLYGKEPQPLKAPQMAPADVDLAFEQEIYLKPLLEMSHRIAKQIGGDDLVKKLKETLQMPVPSLSMKVADLLGKFDSRLIILLRFNKNEFISVPSRNNPNKKIAIPRPDLLLTLENLGWLKETLETELPKIGMVKSEKGGEMIYQPEKPTPAPFDKYKPQLRYNPSTGQLTLVTSPDFLEASRSSSTSKLANLPDYSQLTVDLPKDGNGFFYLHEDFLNRLVAFTKNSLVNEFTNEKKALWQRGVNILQPHLEGTWIGITRNEATGIFIAFNSPYSYKMQEYLKSVGNSGRVLAILMPAVTANRAASAKASRKRSGAEPAAASNAGDDMMPTPLDGGLQIVGIWINAYYNINGKYPASVDDLAAMVEKEKFDEYRLFKNPQTGEEKPYLYAPVSDPKKDVAVPFLANPEPDANGYVTVLFTDMKQRKIPLSEFRKIWPRVKK